VTHHCRAPARRASLAPEAAVAEEAAQALWECWLRERGEARYAEIQAATRAMDAGEHARAEAIFTSLVAAHPGWAEPLNKHSTLLYATRRFAEARAWCRGRAEERRKSETRKSHTHNTVLKSNAIHGWPREHWIQPSGRRSRSPPPGFGRTIRMAVPCSTVTHTPSPHTLPRPVAARRGRRRRCDGILAIPPPPP
jgi:hypothetical protein